MYLKKVNIKEFKKVILKEYKKLFPSSERKSYFTLKKCYKNNITNILEIIEENEFVGFMIINIINNNPYVQLDYFAILPQHQHKGYGSKAINLLKEMCKEYDGIFIEVEKVGYGKNEIENQIRKRRAKFYEKLGFCKMPFDIELYTVLYSAYILPCTKNTFSDENVIKDIFEIYNVVLGKARTKRKCKIIR